jgi:predicted ATPase
MKVSVRNLGVIKEAEIDLKPFTVFIGPNNAGKTWLAYALAAIFGEYGLDKYVQAYIKRELLETNSQLDSAVKQVVEEGNAKIDLVQFADEYAESYFNSVARLAPQWMQEFLDTRRVNFDQLEITLNLGNTKTDLLKRIRDFSLQNDISLGARRQSSLLSIQKKVGDNNLFIFTSTEGKLSDKLPDEAITEHVVRSILRVICEAFYPNIRTFPAERTSFFLLFPHSLSGAALITLLGMALGSLSARVARNDNRFQQKDVKEFNWSIKEFNWPIMHFLIMGGDLFESSNLDREEEAKNNPDIMKFIQLVQLLEKRILGGSMDFSSQDPDSQREILFQAAQDINMELSITSSMVKELATLALYLRYLAKPGEWLIIDEPEMNLHPEAQVLLTEFLAMLVNAGLPVLITTHSPYIVDHLTNLMKAAESNEPEAIQEKFYLKNKNAFIPKDNVSVYLVDQGKTENVLDEDGVVHWGTFGAVSDRVSEIFFEL